MNLKKQAIVITGPSGVGKDTIVQALADVSQPQYQHLAEIVKKANLGYFAPTQYNTTREPRVFTDYATLNQQFLDLVHNFSVENYKKRLNPAHRLYWATDKDITKLYKWMMMHPTTDLATYLNSIYSGLKYKQQLEHLHEDDEFLNDYLHLNGENTYANWIHERDKKYVLGNRLALCDAEIGGNYYVQTLMDVKNVVKKGVCLINATPDSWLEIAEKLRAAKIPVTFVYLDCPDNLLAEHMRKRGDTDEMIQKRLANDKKIWNDEIKQEIAPLQPLYLLADGTIEQLLDLFLKDVVKQLKEEEKPWPSY